MGGLSWCSSLPALALAHYGDVFSGCLDIYCLILGLGGSTPAVVGFGFVEG